MVSSRRARLFRNGRSQAVRIPREFELPGEEVLIRQEGHHLVLEPLPQPHALLDLLATLDPIPDQFPDVDESIPALDDVTL